MTKWITFFSQTGTEILLISKALKRFPDLIITNNERRETWNKELREREIVVISNRPKVEEYNKILSSFNPKDTLITLHGWLRIIPGEICEKWNILNGHPGRIWIDVSLKGFNAQERAWKRGDKIGGSVIHRCTAELDNGEILAKRECIIESLALDEVYKKLHDNSVNLWIDYLKKQKLV